jgi:PAS domain S-box-containing protein
MSTHPSGRLELDAPQLKRMLTNIPFSVVVYEGPEHRAVFSNGPHDEMTAGRIRLGVPLLQSLPELAGQPVIATMDEVFRTGLPKHEDEVAVQLMRGGRLQDCWFQITWQPARSSDDKVIGVMGFAIEITSHVQNRKVLEATAAALRDSDRQFRDLIDNLPELAWSADAGGNIDFYNRRWYEFTGTTLEQMRGWGWQTVHDPQHLESDIARWKHSLACGEPFEMEFPLRGADGAFRWFLTRVRPLRNAGGEILRWIGTNTDIDAQRRKVSSFEQQERP